jgi:hypothetical protein
MHEIIKRIMLVITIVLCTNGVYQLWFRCFHLSRLDYVDSSSLIAYQIIFLYLLNFDTSKFTIWRLLAFGGLSAVASVLVSIIFDSV